MLSTPISCRRLIGRHRELGLLVDLRRDLAKAHGSIALIAGDAGIGKSRLVREFLAATQAARGRVAVAQCRPFGSSPYGPILELLESFAPDAARIAPAASRDAQHKDLVDQVLHASDKHALIGVIEDLHWADLGTAAVLARLADAVATRRILLIVTYRSDELHAGHPLYGTLGALMRGRSARPIELSPLSARETGQFIEAALEGLDAGVPRQTQRDIARAGEGNPFFTEELLKSAVDRGRASRSDRTLPTTVRATILQRMEPLDEHDRRILTQAAVIGRRFDGELLALTMEAPFDSLLPALQRARRCQLIEETDEPNAFRFRHALTREAIYDDLLVAQRRPLHARIARVLETTGGDLALDALAYHWWASGDRAKALQYGERAGDVSLALYEYGGAIAAYDRTLALLDPSGRDAARVHEKIGTAYFRAGLMDRAVDHYLPAWQFFRSTRDDPNYLFRLTRNTAGAMFNDGRASEAIEFWSEALPVIAACGDTRIADLARVTFAAYLIDDGHVDETIAALAPVAKRRLEGDPELALPFWASTCVAAALQGDATGVRDAVERLCSIPRERSLLGPLNDALGEAGMAALYVGEAQSARRCLSGALDACVEMKSTAMLLADTLLANAFERVLAGDYAGARSMHERALGLLNETKVSWFRAWCIGLWVGTATGDGALLAAEPDAAAIESALATGKAQLFGPLVAAYADLLAGRTRHDEARRWLRLAVAAATNATLSLGSFPLAVSAAQWCDDADAPSVRALCARDVSKGIAPRAAFYLIEAIFARRFGDRSEGAAPARRAAALFGEIGWPLFEAMSFEQAGETETAAQIRERIGHVGRAAPPAGAGQSHLGALLSRRETEIARLVAEGRTNREIGAALFVSVKSVEKTLSAIYRKLSIRSRSQLTARVFSNGVLDPTSASEKRVTRTTARRSG